MTKATKPRVVKPKKEVEKTFIEEVKTAITGKGAYHLYIKLNDKAYEVDTDNLVEAIDSFRPAILKTAITLKMTKGKRTLDRYIYLKDGRRLFQNKLTLEMFVHNLVF